MIRTLVALVLVAIAAGAIAARADDKGAAKAPKVVVAKPAPGAPPRVLFPKTPCAPVDNAKPTGAPPSQALLGAFAILRRPAQPSDALPAEALKALQRVGMAPVAPGAARLLRTTTTGGRAWIVPVPDVAQGLPFLCRAPKQAKPAAHEGVAVVALGDAASGGGGALDDLVRGRAPVSSDECAGSNHDMLGVSGVVPDGVAAVFLTAPDGTAVRADVKDNGYEFVVAHPRTSQQRYVVWTGADGTPHVQPILATATPRSKLCSMIAKLAALQPRVSPGPGSDLCAAVPVLKVPVPVLKVPSSPKTAPPAVRLLRVPPRGRLPQPVYAGGCAAGPVVITGPPVAVPKRHK
jgi:hypothetical protein